MRVKVFVLSLATVTLMIAPASAAQARPASGAHAHGSATPVGNDISYPQCGQAYPSGQAFGIVGVNGGTASDFNPCFSLEWPWAQQGSVGGTSQPRAQLYVNTGNPGDVLAQYGVTDWPSSSVPSDPYFPACSGADDMACSWEYGYDRATKDIAAAGALTGTRWWLDVETSNSWTSDPAKNRASLEGMTDALKQHGAIVGIYATSGAWAALVGTVDTTSPLYSLPEWRPGARTLAEAQGNCALAPFEGNGKVEITQYVAKQFDGDYSCA